MSCFQRRSGRRQPVPKGTRLLAAFTLAVGCGQVRDSALGSYQLESLETQYGAVSGRLFSVSFSAREIEFGELVSGKIRSLSQEVFEDRILSLRVTSDTESLWVGVTLCMGNLLEDPEQISCSGGTHVQVLRAYPSGKLSVVADSVAGRPERTRDERLTTGPFVFGDSIILGVVDDMTGASQRLILRGGRLQPLEGDDGSGIFCATRHHLFRVQSTPDYENSRNVGLVVQRWREAKWSNLDLNIDEEIVYDLSLACTSSEAIVVKQKTGGADLVLVTDGRAAPVQLDSALISGPTTLASHQGDPNQILLSTVNQEDNGTATITWSTLNNDRVEPILGPVTRDEAEKSSVTFLVGDANGGLVGITDDGTLEVKRGR